MSATVSVSSECDADGNNLKNDTPKATKKIEAINENGELTGYAFLSPLSGRKIFVPLNNRFNHSYCFPTFERSVFVPASEDYPEEHLMIINGVAAIIKLDKDGNSDIVGCYELQGV